MVDGGDDRAVGRGSELLPRIFKDIEAAHSSVHILMFGWREGYVGMRMARLLERKIAEGVEVRVIVDGYGSRPYGEAREMFTRLAERARRSSQRRVPARPGRALPDDQQHRLAAGRSGSRRPPQAVRDRRRVAWTGGAGIEDHFENGGFHDVMVRVTGDVVRQAQAAFLTSFRGHGGPLPATSALFPMPPESGRRRSLSLR